MLLLINFTQMSAAVALSGILALRLLAVGWPELRWRGLAWVCWAALLVAGFVQLALVTAKMSGALSAANVIDILDSTSYGAAWKLRICLVAGLGVSLMTRRRLVIDALGAALNAAVLMSIVWSGHAQASTHRAWLLVSDATHAIAAGIWPGGLGPLTFLLFQARRDSGLTGAAAAVTRRFSRLSVPAVWALAFSGVLNSVGMLGSFPALWESGYGRLIILKAALLSGLIALGWCNRRLLREPSELEGCVLQRLRRNVAWETIAAVAALAAAEALACMAPPG